MHVHAFAKMCQFVKHFDRRDCTFGTITYDATEKVRECLLKTHPKQFISTNVEVPLYEIHYSYETQRKNERQGVKYLFSSYMPSDEYELEIMAEGKLRQWVSDFNFANPHRRLDNVKILSVNFVAESRISLST